MEETAGEDAQVDKSGLMLCVQKTGAGAITIEWHLADENGTKELPVGDEAPTRFELQVARQTYQAELRPII